ncbi:hypothetical protein K5549_004197, partial [Capra hircus]
MEKANESSLIGFVLLGFSDHPRLEAVLFVIVLLFYLLTLVGNITIIIISYLDPPLHTPMYFFLSNLSFLDICFTTSLAPQTLVNLRGPEKTITYGGCVVQLYISLALGSTECILLVVMALDRYVAVCKPLHYVVIMNPRLCQQLAFISWFSGLANSLIHATFTLQLPFCGNHRLDHFICEVPALLKLACVDTTINELVLFVVSILFLLIPSSTHPYLLWLHNSSSAEAQISGGKAQSLQHLLLPPYSGDHFLWHHNLHVPATKQQLCSGPRQVHLTFLYHGDPHLKSYYLYFKKQGCERCSEETSHRKTVLSTDM